MKGALDRQREDQQVVLSEQTNERSREGLVLSRPSHNLEGNTEKELRRKRLAETVPCRQYKVRRRKEVPVEE